MSISRRKFIRTSSLAAAGTLFIPQFLKGFELGSFSSENEKVLVIIQLGGGNDGLNTVVPFNNDIYYKSRPGISIKKEQLLKLNDELGFNSSLKGLKDIFDDGAVQIINNVGYPNPNRSHFRSMDIWQTASDSDLVSRTGWLGRYLDSECQPCKQSYAAVELNDSLSLALKGEKSKGIGMSDPHKLYQAANNSFVKEVAKNSHPARDGSNASYLYKTLIDTVSASDYIYQKSKIFKSKNIYPHSAIGRDLKTVSELIISGSRTKIYYLSLPGFDTHINQVKQHALKLNMYSEAVTVFVKDLKENNRFRDVMIMTFSEFGRRVSQNASNGTDHGTANNLFLISGNLKNPGCSKEIPDLNDLDQGDLKFSVDFRRIYASLLDKWLDVKHSEILGKTYDPLII